MAESHDAAEATYLDPKIPIQIPNANPPRLLPRCYVYPGNSSISLFNLYLRTLDNGLQGLRNIFYERHKNEFLNYLL
jgi:hypothetical protein